MKIWKSLIIVSLLFSSSLYCQETEWENLAYRIEPYAYNQNEYALVLLDSLKNYTQPECKPYVTFAEALIHFGHTEYAEAEQKIQETFALLEKNKNIRLFARTNYLLGILYERKSNYVEKIKYIKIAEENALLINDEKLLRRCYHTMTMSYLDHRDFDLALNSAEKALFYSEKLNSQSSMALDMAVLGEVYREKGEYQTAENYFSKAYKIQKEINSTFNMAWTLTNWSLVYTEDPIKRLELHYQAQSIWDSLSPDNTMSLVNLGNMARAYIIIAENDSVRNRFLPVKSKHELYQIAESYYNRTIKTAGEKENLYSLYYNLIEMSKLQKEKGDFANAYNNLERGWILKDSLFSQENKNEIARLNSQRELESKENEILLNELEIKSQQRQNALLLFGLCLLGLTGFLIYRQSVIRKSNNNTLKVLNDELVDSNNAKIRFFNIINHDLRSPVSNLIHFLYLKKENIAIDDPRAENQIYEGVENLLITMEDLLLWSKGQMKNFKPDFQNVPVNLLFEYVKINFSGYDNIRFEYTVSEKNECIWTDENYLKTIMRNLTTNAIKALSSRDEGVIHWKSSVENGKVILSVSDNGTGAGMDKFKTLFDEEKAVETKSGLGLHLVRDLAKTINCTLSVNSEVGKGTTIFLKF